MANATVLHQLKVSAQYMSEGAQRFVDSLARELLAADELADGLSVSRSNTVTTTGAAIKASAGKLYGIIIEPDATGATGTGGTGVLHLYNAATVTNLVPGGGTAVSLFMGAVKFVTGMTQCVKFTPAAVDSTSLYTSGIAILVSTAVTGSTAVASLPKITVVYS